MSYEFDLEYMNECMEPFSLSCPDDETYTSKLEEICRVYHQTMDNLVDEIVSVMQNDKRNTVNMQIIEHLERKLEGHVTKTVGTPKSAKKTARKPLADRTFATIGKTCDDTQNDNYTEMETTEVSITALTGKFSDFSPYQNSPSNLNFLKRKDAGKIASIIQGPKHVERDQGATISTFDTIQVISKQPEAYYGGEKSYSIIAAKNTRFAQFANDFQQNYDEITEWGNPTEPAVDAIYAYGQIAYDDTKDYEKFGEYSSCLMIDDENGTIIPLDFSKIQDDVTLFPGQFVAIKGINETGAVFMVEKIFETPKLLLPRISSEVSGDIWFASGPFTSSENCNYEHLCEFLDTVLKENPSVLVLTGPFIDRKNNFVNTPEFTLTYEMLMEDLFIKIEQKLANSNTELIIQTSAVRDYCIPPVFPSSAFKFLNKKIFGKKFHFVPDPCVLKIGEIEMAITTSEIVTHLSKSEFHRSTNQENLDRIARLNSHLLSQKSLYPLEPAEIPSSMHELIEVCNLTSAPHILVAPCVLAPYVKTIDQTVFVNPSVLAKASSGTFIKSSIFVKNGQFDCSTNSIADFSVFEIVKV